MLVLMVEVNNNWKDKPVGVYKDLDAVKAAIEARHGDRHSANVYEYFTYPVLEDGRVDRSSPKDVACSIVNAEGKRVVKVFKELA